LTAILAAVLVADRIAGGQGSGGAALVSPLLISRSVAPDFGLRAVNGDTISLKDYRGQVVLLNFWATWCPPCKAEMPDLEALYREHGAARGFAVLGINMQEEVGVVRAFAERQGVTFPLLLDTDGEVATRQFAIRSLPTTLIIDREGRIRDAWHGQLSRAAMLSRLEQVW
jgi:peroxiredoxin